MASRKLIEYSIVLILLAFVTALLVGYFNTMPIEGTTLGMDFRGLWKGLQGGRPNYVDNTGLRIAPWSVPILLPFGLLPYRSSWGLLALVTLAVLVASVPRVPRRWLYWLSVFVLITSFPALRQLADGNFEALIIAGVLLIVAGLRRQSPLITAAGLLMATGKLQETWLLMPVIGFYLLTTWPRRRLLILIGIVALVVAVCFVLFGQSWFDTMMGISEQYTIVNMNLLSTATRLGMAQPLAGLLWIAILAGSAFFSLFSRRSLSREKAAMLICASLLLAPYAAGNSFLTVLAIGIIPLFQADWRVGVLLLVLASWQYVAPHDFLYWWSSNFWAALLLLTWGVLNWRIYRDEMRPGLASDVLVRSDVR